MPGMPNCEKKKREDYLLFSQHENKEKEHRLGRMYPWTEHAMSKYQLKNRKTKIYNVINDSSSADLITTIEKLLDSPLIP
jgi:hypothetical protein